MKHRFRAAWCWGRITAAVVSKNGAAFVNAAASLEAARKAREPRY